MKASLVIFVGIKEMKVETTNNYELKVNTECVQKSHTREW